VRVGSHFLSAYPPFSWLPRRVGRLAGVLNVSIATLAAVMIVVGAARDNTFTLMNGVGLLEHPGIWIYLVAQPVLPQLLDRALRTFTRIGIDQRQLFTSAFARTTVRAERKLLFERIKRTSAAGPRVFYQILVLVGAGAWILNTFKNQAPLQAYGFDVWDAWPHLWGYWTTRVYKAYVAMFLAPAMVHALIVIVYNITQLMVRASREAGMKLDPYAADEAGGTRRLIDMV
jgi:hypothetical protein